MSSFPTCQVCHKQFSLKGPAPFLLPCLHAVCETCVESAAGGVVSCSPCQRDVNLTETPLQKDVVREKEILHLTVKHQPELVLCTHEEDGIQAVCWCEECEDFLCEHCQMVHNSFKATRRHVVQGIGELETKSLEEDLYCKVHPKYILDTWDESCCILTCGKCRLEEHAQHKAITIEHAAELARREVVILQKDVTSAADQHEAKIAATEEDLKSSEDKYIMIPHKITNTLYSLKTVIDQREKELQIEMQQHKEKDKEDLTEKKHTSEAYRQRCQILSDYIEKALQYSSMNDIMSIKYILQSKTEECIRSAQNSVHDSPPLPRFNIDGLEKIKSVLSGFGTIESKDVPLVVKQTKDNGTQTEDLMSRTCEDMKQELEQMKKENQTLRENRAKEETEKQNGLHRLKANVTDVTFLLNCTSVEFSKKRYNAITVNINRWNELVNKSQTNPPYSDQRLKKYTGTSSTVPLPRCGSTQYFEVKSRVGIEETLPEDVLLLEIGLVREEEQDQSYCLATEPNTYSLTINSCTSHNSICRTVWRHENRLTCVSDTLENTPGTSATLHYGVVYNSARSRIAFLDVKNEKIICRVRNIESSVRLWPMFGVYSDADFVSMSLVVGSDIDMAGWKKDLILKSLS